MVRKGYTVLYSSSNKKYKLTVSHKKDHTFCTLTSNVDVRAVTSKLRLILMTKKDRMQM